MNQSWIERVRQWMKLSGTSQEKVARALDCTRGAVGHYLAGRRQPTLFQLERIAGIMGVHPAWLLYGVGPADTSDQNVPFLGNTRPNATLPLLSGNNLRTSDRPCGFLEIDTISSRCYGVKIAPGHSSPRAMAGETLLIDPAATPHPGDQILITFKDGSAELYELVSVRQDQISLSPLNDHRQRESYSPEDVEFIHRVVAVLRQNAFPLRPTNHD